MRLLYSILYILLATSALNAQWTNQNPVPNGNDLWSTFFINQNTGWIVGSDGFIKKTTNSGQDWILQKSGTSLTLKSIQFLDLNSGWICGEDGIILRTSDGGNIWHKITEGTSVTLTSLDFCSENIGYIAGCNGTILKTTDSGITWAVQLTSKEFNLFSVDFIDNQLGFAAGSSRDSVVLLKTTNGGVDWIKLSLDLGINNINRIYKVLFLNEQKGYIGGGSYDGTKFIYKTTDGGSSWNECTFEYESSKQTISKINLTNVYESGGINSIYFENLNNGYATGGFCNGWDRVIYTTTDGGSTWINKYYGSEQDGLLSVCGNNSGKAWAVGFTGTIFITENSGNSWTQILSGNKSTMWSGDDIHSIFFLDENNGWAAGKRNTEIPGVGDVILKTTNGGKIWKTQYYCESSNGLIRTIYFLNDNIGWTVGVNGLMKTSDGGSNWYFGGLSCGAVSVFFINESVGWASNDYSEPEVSGIYKSTDGGVNWVRKSETRISDIYFSSINTGWAVGPDGTLLRTTNGGESWTDYESSITSDLNSIKFYGNLGVCVGGSGTFLLTTDAGAGWELKNSETPNALNSVYITDPEAIWATGEDGVILHTSDLGNTWISYNNITGNDLNSVFFYDKSTGWVGGLNGTIYKYENEILPVELISFTAGIRGNGVVLEWQTAMEINNYGFEIERNIDKNGWNKIGYIVGHGSTSDNQYYSYADNHLPRGGTYKYRLKQIDLDGTFIYSNEVEIYYSPENFILDQNYPNPFNPNTTINWELPVAEQVTLKVYDLLGNQVATLVNEHRPAGKYQTKFDITEYSKDFSSGIYIYRLKTGNFSSTKKMLLLK